MDKAIFEFYYSNASSWEVLGNSQELMNIFWQVKISKF